MCGRFTLVISLEMLAEIFGSPVLVDLPQRYNIAPTKQVFSIRRTEAVNQASFMRWGLIPSWAKDASIGSRMINARSETVHEITSFRAAIRHRRCIMPANGFFEWNAERRFAAMENRRYSRVHFESKALVRGLDQSFKFVALTENLSLNGLYIRTKRRLPVGKEVEITLEIRSSTKNPFISVPVKVVRFDVKGMAFQYGSLDQDALFRLRTVINRSSLNRLKKYYSA